MIRSYSFGQLVSRLSFILALGLGLILINTTANAQNNTLMKYERRAGYKLLFDGKTLNGWHNYGTKGVRPQWVVDDEAIHLSQGQGRDIVTDKAYENFILELDWKISTNGNSGLFYLVNEDTAKYKSIWNTAPEYQILDNEGHKDGQYENHRAGANYDLITPLPGHTKPVGEYNHTKLVVNKGKVEHWLNGTLVVSYTLWTPEWEALVAASKFKKYPGYGRSKVGRIGLQDHGDKVWFRNIKIKKL
jgi:hypothetical protein